MAERGLMRELECGGQTRGATGTGKSGSTHGLPSVVTCGGANQKYNSHLGKNTKAKNEEV